MRVACFVLLSAAVSRVFRLDHQSVVNGEHISPPNTNYSATCISDACTTHCNASETGSCCMPLTCKYDAVFSDTRCIPPPPLICELEAGTTMRGYAANSIKGPKTASFKADLPVPKIGSLHETFREIPGNYSNCEVLVKVMYSSVNPSDITPSIGRDGDQEVVLGSDMAGVVVKTGSNCKRLKEGSQVWGDIGANAHLARTGTKTKELGAYGEYTVALESQLGIIPLNMTFQEAGSLPKVALTSYKALVWYANAPWVSSDNITVVVLGGSGGTGTIGIQLAKHFGAGKIISTCGADNFNYCKANGADQLIDYHTHNWWDVLEDNSVQVIYDTVGEEGTGNHAMQKITSGGYFITIAGSLATKVKPGVTQNFFINSDTNLNNIPEMDALGEIAMAGALRMPKFYKTFKLEDVAQGFNVSRTGHVVGKVSIEISHH